MEISSSIFGHFPALFIIAICGHLVDFIYFIMFIATALVLLVHDLPVGVCVATECTVYCLYYYYNLNSVTIIAYNDRRH